MNEINILKKIKLFGDLKSFEWNELNKITKENEYKENGIIFAQGEESTELYILIKGEVEINIKIATQLAESTVYTVKPYDVFGEFAFVDPKPRSATARCLKDSTILMIRKDAFEELSKRFPDIGMNFYRCLAGLLSERLRKMNNYVKEIFLRSVGLELIT